MYVMLSKDLDYGSQRPPNLLLTHVIGLCEHGEGFLVHPGVLSADAWQIQ